MGIIGAVVSGVTAGNAVTNFIFNYSKSEYAERITKIQGLITELDGHLARLENYKNRLSGIWSDEAGASALKSIQATINITKTKQNNAKQVMNMFQNMIENLDAGQGEWNAKMEEALGLLTGLEV